MTQPKKFNWIVFTVLVVAAIATRFIPHPFNFTAIGAVALFSGAIMPDKRFSYLVPLALLFISDLFIGFHFSMLPVYGSFMITVWIGTRIKQNPNWKSIISGSIISSVVFFLVTNLPFWYIDQKLYPLTLEGTLESYKMAIPFFRNQVIGDLFYCGLLFGIYSLIPAKGTLTPVSVKK